MSKQEIFKLLNDPDIRLILIFIFAAVLGVLSIRFLPVLLQAV